MCASGEAFDESMCLQMGSEALLFADTNISLILCAGLFVALMLRSMLAIQSI